MKRQWVISLMWTAFLITGPFELWAGEPPKARNQDDLKELVRGNNEFAFDLYRQLSQKEGNLIFSPYSISTALAMTYAGARGETAKEMAKVLHFTLPGERLHSAFAEVVGTLQEEKERPYQLRTANALWGQQAYPFRDSFLRLCRNRYRAGLQELDFIGQTEKARQAINRWVAEQTKDKIKELLGPRDLKPVTRLVLTNAIYLKASWATPFLKGETKDALFEVSPAKKIFVPMMHTQEGPFKYFADKNCQWLELPYQGDGLSMILLLPQKGRLLELEKVLTAGTIQQGVEKLKFHRGKVALPRCKVNKTFKLASELISMGMPLAFSGNADFSGMTGGGGLWIDNVFHQGYLKVDELGSEAAAATAVVMITSNFPPFSFTADRPFLFLLRDKQTGSILFLGRVVQPGKLS